MDVCTDLTYEKEVTSTDIIFFMFIYSWGWCTEGQREGDTDSKQASGSVLIAQSLTWGLNSWTLRSWPELKSDAQPTELSRHLVIDTIFFLFDVYLFLRHRETEHEWRRVRETGRHRIWNRLQAPSYQHRARCGARTHGVWDHDLSRSRSRNRLSHPGAPTPKF